MRRRSTPHVQQVCACSTAVEGSGPTRLEQSTLSPDGVTVGVLHTGRSYADDLLPDGIVYHYPRTTVPGRDAQEVGATKAAKDLALPVFVVVQPDSTSRRVVHLGWVEDWDDGSELFSIAFGGAPPPSMPSATEEDDLPFELERATAPAKKVSVTSRPAPQEAETRPAKRVPAQPSGGGGIRTLDPPNDG